ncbi:MAG: dihydroorotase [Thermoplasmata archaeon]|nr:dihydroorotase [Thermoplasmata archaeon]
MDGELRYTEVGIADGKIVTVGSYVSGGDERISLGTSEILLPGFIDPHVHLRDPGMTQKEDFHTGTLAAIHAGVTCVYDMPNTKPPVVDVRTFNEKKAAIRGKAVTDYGLFAAVTPGINARMLAPLVVGFKLFMGSTTGNILLDDDEELIPAVTDALATGRRLSVHAEDDKLIEKEEERCCRDHLRNRPARAETQAISRLASNFSGRNINICHITTPEGLDMAHAAGFSVESTLHHILFEVDRHTGTEYKVNPPIRDIQTRDELFKRFVKGEPDMIGTDHAPHTAEEKEQDFQSAPSGIPGVETTMPMVMEYVRRGTMQMSDAVRMACHNPGYLFDVPKGRIAEGYDADLVVFDMRNVSKIEVPKLHSRCGHSPYAGCDAVFPKDVYLRGSLQVMDGEFCGEPIGDDVRGLRGRFFRDCRQEG